MDLLQLLQLGLLGLAFATGIPALICTAKALSRKEPKPNSEQQPVQISYETENCALRSIVVFVPKAALRKIIAELEEKGEQKPGEEPAPKKEAEAERKPRLVERAT